MTEPNEKKPSYLCHHGTLRRKCDICELDEQLDEKDRRITELEMTLSKTVYVPIQEYDGLRAKIAELESQIANFMDYGQGGASFKESQLHAKIEQQQAKIDLLCHDQVKRMESYESLYQLEDDRIKAIEKRVSRLYKFLGLGE